MQSSNTSANSGNGTDSGNTGKSGNKMILIAIAVILVIAIIVVLALALGSGSATSSVSASIGSTAGTPVYLGATQSQALIGQLANYQTFDLFNSSSIVNITYINTISNLTAGNVTEGWGTIAYGQNATSNQTIQYYVMISNNASQVSASIVSTIGQEFYATPPETQYGNQNGLSYTYQLYENGTADFQSLTGYKNGYVVLAYAISNPGYLVNQTELAGIAANET